MRVFAQTFWIPKAGSSDVEYEDAFWPKKPLCRQGATFRFAAADGATETSFSRIWARQLVRSFCEGRLDPAHIGDELEDLQQRWSKVVRRQLARRKSVSWYTEEKIHVGAFASILGVAFREEVHSENHLGEWQAMALGDTCLVQMREEEILARFPLENSESFGSRPHLLSSNPAYNSQVRDHLRTAGGNWHVDDAFYLMTDALACWFLREAEEGRSPWGTLRDFDLSEGLEPFRDFVGNLRRNGAIRNDDVTLLCVKIA